MGQEGADKNRSLKFVKRFASSVFVFIFAAISTMMVDTEKSRGYSTWIETKEVIRE
jgi:hypothetical protein